MENGLESLLAILLESMSEQLSERSLVRLLANRSVIPLVVTLDLMSDPV